jgi:hypothetical protein
MRIRLLIVPAVLLLGGLLAACDMTDAGEFEEEVVVEAYLVAGEPLPEVRLSRTAPLNTTYDATERAVSEAEVEVHLLDEDGDVATRYAYTERSNRPGVYAPLAPEAVAPLRSYRLDVTTPDGSRITGTTVVPDTFAILSVNADTVIYQSAEQLEVVISRSQFPERDQTYFNIVTEALDVQADRLVPLAAEVYDGGDGDVTLEDLRLNGSPPFNEANFEINPDNTITLRYPWLGVTFYGPNRVSINALGDNLYDFLRSATVQQGGSTFSPGEIPDVITRLDGALGVFGSLARVQVEAVVVPPSAPSGPSSTP